MPHTFTEQDFEQPALPFSESDFEQPPIAPQREPSSALRRYVADPAIALANGIIGLPEAAVGLADIPTLGLVGKLLEAGGYGFQPKVAKDYLSTLYSREQQAASERVRQAKGFFPTLKAMGQNPSTIAETVIESAPSMLGGAGVARKLLTSVPRIGALIAGAAGEGAITAGQSAEQTRQESADGTLTPKQAALSLTSGAATGVIGVVGGGLARRLGVADIDTLMAGGVAAATKKNILRRAVESAITEGAFEELSQSAQEQWQQNLASGRPAGEGVAEAAASGLLAGLVMGGVGGAASGPLSRVNRGARAAIARGPRREAAPLEPQGAAIPIEPATTLTPSREASPELSGDSIRDGLAASTAVAQPGVAEVGAAQNPNLEQDLALLGDVMRELRGQIGVSTQADLISVAKSPKPLVAVRDQIRRLLTTVERREQDPDTTFGFREKWKPLLETRLNEIERQMMPPVAVRRAPLPENIGGTLGVASEDLPPEIQALDQGKVQRVAWEAQMKADLAAKKAAATDKQSLSVEPTSAKPPELMTPEEAGITLSEPAEYPPSNAKRRFGPLELKSPSATPEAVARWKAEQKAYRDHQKRAKEKTAKSNAYWYAIENAVKAEKPISISAAEFRYRNEIPAGYTRSGDQYVFKPSVPNAPQGAPLTAAGETTPIGVEQTPAAAGGAVKPGVKAKEPWQYVEGARSREDFKQGVIAAANDLPNGSKITDSETGETWTVNKSTRSTGTQVVEFEAESSGSSSFSVEKRQGGDWTIIGSPDGGAFSKTAALQKLDLAPAAGETTPIGVEQAPAAAGRSANAISKLEDGGLDDLAANVRDMQNYVAFAEILQKERGAGSQDQSYWLSQTPFFKESSGSLRFTLDPMGDVAKSIKLNESRTSKSDEAVGRIAGQQSIRASDESPPANRGASATVQPDTSSVPPKPEPNPALPVESQTIVGAMVDAARQSVESLRSKIRNVKYGRVENNEITFDFEGKPHVGVLRGRNRGLVLGSSPESDAGVATRVFVDGDAKPTPTRAENLRKQALAEVERQTKTSLIQELLGVKPAKNVANVEARVRWDKDAKELSKRTRDELAVIASDRKISDTRETELAEATLQIIPEVDAIAKSAGLKWRTALRSKADAERVRFPTAQGMTRGDVVYYVSRAIAERSRSNPPEGGQPARPTEPKEPTGSFSTTERAELNELRQIKADRGKLGAINNARLIELEAQENGVSGPVEIARVEQEDVANHIVDQNVNYRSYRKIGDDYVVFSERDNGQGGQPSKEPTKPKGPNALPISGRTDTVSRERRGPEGVGGTPEPAANLGTGLAEGRGMSPDAARAAIAGEPTAGFTVEIISKERAEEVTGRPEARGYGGFFWQGKIYLVHENMAAGDVDGAKALLREEVGHGLLRTKEGSRRLQEVLDEGRLQLTEAEKQALRDQGYLENQLLDEFIAKSSRENRSWWASAVEKIRVWLSKVGLVNLTNEEVARVLLSEIARTRQADIGNLPGERLVARNAIIIAPGITPPAAITAYHGTPHKVDRFSTANIGTGEGAQVYGWGLYFAENPEVGQTYRRALSGRFEEWTFSTLNAAALKLSEILGQPTNPSGIILGPDGTKPATYNGGQGSVTVGKSPISPYRDRYTVQFQPFGNDYTVTLNVTPDELLDWDKPLSEQSEKVKAVLAKMVERYGGNSRSSHYAKTPHNFQGGALLDAAKRDVELFDKQLPENWRDLPTAKLRELSGTDKDASELLSSLGIKGIRYLDQGSRIKPDKETISGLPQTYNYVIFNDSDISITHENGQPVSLREVMGANPLLPDLAPGQPTGEDDRPRRTVTGVENLGPRYTPQAMAPITELVRKHYFDSTKPVNDDDTRRAQRLVERMIDPVEGQIILRELKQFAAAQGIPADAIGQLLVNELADYARNLTVAGKPDMAWDIVLNWGDFQTVAGGSSAAGRTQRAIQESEAYNFYSETNKHLKRAAEAGEKLVGRELFDALNSFTEQPEVPQGVTTKVGRKTIKPTTPGAPPETVDAALENANAKTALSILDRFEVKPTEWLKPDRVENPVVVIVREALASSEPIYENPDPFIKTWSERLQELEVPKEIADRLALEIHKERTMRWTNARERAIIRASKRGTLSALVEEIRQTPYLLQRSPDWLRTTSENWFMSHGLSREQAEEAAKEFVPEFMEALTVAVEREATAVLKDKKLAQGTIDLIVRSIRSGLFDPAKYWYSDALAERGFKNITEADFKLLAELDKKMADPDRSLVEVSETMDAALAVWRRLGPPPAVVDSMSSNMLASFLTGFRTFGVNLFGPLIYDLTEMALTAPTSPRSVGFMAKDWALGFKPWWNAVRTSMGRDAYSFLDGEWYAAQNHLKALWERGRRQMGIPDGWDIRKGWPQFEQRTLAERGKGLTNIVYGSQQFLMRLLSALDNANGMKRRDMMAVLYTSQAMRRLGFSTQEIRAVVDMVYSLREHFYQQSIESGRPKALAVVRANDLAHQSFIDYMKGDLSPELKEAIKASETLNDARWTPEVVKQIEDASALEGHSVVGRLGKGVQESDEGGVASRVVMNNLIELGNWMTRKSGLAPAIRVQMFGYMNVPWRTFRFYGWFGPSGLLRGGHHLFRSKVLNNKTNWWQQSMANEVQSRQRWKMIIASNVVFAGLIALGFKKSTDADDEDDTGVYFTGAGPKNKQLKSAWTANKFKPYSMVVSINGHKMAVDMTRSFEPLAHMTWMLAAQDDAAWRKKEAEAKGKPYESTVSDETAAAAGTYFGIMSQRGFMQAIAQAGEIASGRQDPRMFLAQKGSSFAAGLVTPYLGLQQSIAGMLSGSVDRSSIQSAIAANVPALEIFGDAIRKPTLNRFGDPLYNPEKSWYHRMYYTGIPIAFSVADSPTNKALYGLLVEKGVAPPEVRRSTLEQKYGQLSDDQFQQFVTKNGALLKGDVVRNIPTLKNMTPVGVKSFLDKSADTANRITAMGMGLESRTPPRTSAAPAVSALPATSSSRTIPVSVGVATGRARAAISRVPRTSRTSRAIRLTSRRPRIRATVSRARRAIGTRFARVRMSARGVIARIRRPRFGLSFA